MATVRFYVNGNDICKSAITAPERGYTSRIYIKHRPDALSPIVRPLCTNEIFCFPAYTLLYGILPEMQPVILS